MDAFVTVWTDFRYWGRIFRKDELSTVKNELSSQVLTKTYYNEVERLFVELDAKENELKRGKEIIAIVACETGNETTRILVTDLRFEILLRSVKLLQQK